MNPTYIRIALRYAAGYLVLKNILPKEVADVLANDPELVTIIGVAIAGLVEGAYALAKRLGWRT